ncbi:cold shock domain-containing protein [Streptomyces sp. CB01881]|uniref:cold-shock protein n=1 Tax=Streptomyces sp. CB01881 TaxID=2078691 RepID=UPI000CDC9D97|nr:cold shock domain-containing protein [Streptomyces sp. CB01881]AUY48884.1 cold-shock protein [Streptomyces sp. CB01881]TYC77374.1 cold-shock protein [Streptomyces sp. CB01881]
MATGTVSTYNAHHGYGTITPDDEGPALYVYFDSIVGEGDRALDEGQRVEYDPTEQEGRPVAERVRPL